MTIADLKKKAESGAYVDNNARELDTFKAKYSQPKTPAQVELSNPVQINPNVLSGMDILNAQTGKVNAPVEVEAAAGASLKKAGLTDAYNEWLDKQYANNSTALMDYLNARYDQDRLESRWLGVPVTLPEHSGKGAGAEEVEKAAKKAKMALKLTDEQLNDIFERTKLTGLQEANYYAGRTLSGAASSVAGAAQLAAALPYYGLSVAGGLIDRTADAVGGSTQFENFFGDTAKNIMTGDPLGANRFANYVNGLVKGKYLSQTQQTISNLAENAGAMVPAIATGNIAGMLGATAAGAEAANFAVFGGGAAGNATQRAMQEGADIGTALSYGVMSGMVEVITEKMFAGVAGMNKSGVIDDLIKGLKRNGTMRMLVDTLGEGVEEIVAEVIDPFLKRATYDQNATNADLKDLLEAAKSGVLLSLIMNAAGVAMRGGDISALMGSTEGMTEAETLRNDKYGRLGKTDTGMVDDTLNNYNQRIDDIINTDREGAVKGLIRSGLSGQEGGEAYNLAWDMRQRYAEGEDLTSGELRQLYKANDNEIRQENDAEIERLAKVLTPSLSAALIDNYDNTTSPARYYLEMQNAYNAAQKGEAYKGDFLNANQISAAMQAAQSTQNNIAQKQNTGYNLLSDDYIREMIEKGEIPNVGKQSSSTNAERENNLASVEQGGSLEARAGEAKGRRPGSFEAQRAATIAANAEVQRAGKVSGQEIHLRGTSSEKSFKVIPRSVWSQDESLDKIAQNYKKRGMNVVFIYGNIGLEGGGYARGAHRGNVMYINIADGDATAEQIAAHEYFHDFLDRYAQTGSKAFKKSADEARSWAVQQLVKKIRSTYGDGIDELMGVYAETYFTDEDGNITVDADYILEEILCDAAADIDILAGRKAETQRAPLYGEAVREELNRMDEAVTRADTDDGGEKFSIARTSKMTLNEQLKAYYDGKMRSSDAFYFGETPAVLSKSGLSACPLAMTISDFRKSTKEKHNIPRRVLKNLNNDLKSPLLSFGRENDIGFVVDDIDGDGKKLLIGVHGNSVMDRKNVNTIESLYGLDNPTEWVKNQIDAGKEFVLYDEEKANAFLQTYGYLASVEDGIRFVGDNISQKAEEVNTDFSRVTPQQDADYLAAVERGDMETAQRMVDEAAEAAGYTIHAYHGTARADRVGNVFRPERSTSGPMAFFTDSEEIASNYARDKRDTSISYDTDYDSYETQFRAKHGKTGKDYAIYKLWGYIPMSERSKIAEKAKHIRIDIEGDGEIIYDPNATEANGGWNWQLKEFHGDVLKALNEQWLNSGNLFNEEGEYLRVLELAGVNDALKKAGFEVPRYMDPEYRQEAVYDVFLKIKNPFDATSMIDETFIKRFEEFAEENETKYRKENFGADYWDKNNVSAELFSERMRDDLKSGTTYAWTSIPDVMTAYLEQLGYDGIKDAGGKNGGVGHTVWIPFTGEQVKRTVPVTYDDAGNVIPLSERFNPENDDIRYSRVTPEESTIARLEAENARLRERAEYWQKQTKLTKPKILNHKGVGKIASELLTEYDSISDHKELHAALFKLGNEILRGREEGHALTWERVTERAETLARDILNNSRVLVNTDEYRELTELKKYLKDNKIRYQNDGNIPDFPAWRKQHKGLNLRQKEGTPADIAYNELRERFGNALFPEDIINPADQVIRMGEVLNGFEPVFENPYSYDMALAVEEAADDIIDRLLNAAEDKSFADKQEERYQALKADSAAKLSEAKAKAEAKQAEAIKALKADNAARLREIRKQRDDKIKTLKEYYAAAKRDRAEAKADSEARSRLLRIVKRLKNRKLPAATRAMLDGYIADIDTAAKSITGKSIEKLSELRDWYNEQIENNPNFVRDEGIEKALQRLSSRKIGDMSAEEVADLTNVLLGIEHEIREHNKFIESEYKKNIYEAGAQTVMDLQDVKGASLPKLNKLETEMLSPIRAIHRFVGYKDDSPLMIFANELNEGQHKMLDYQRKAYEAFNQFLEDKEFMKSLTGKHATKIKVQGITPTGEAGEAYISPAMRIALAAHAMNPQNVKHIVDGGVTIPDFDLYSKGKQAEAYSRNTRLRFTKSQLEGIAATLTPKEREFLNAVMTYFNVTSRKAINETSEKLKGYSLADVENYFPINSDDAFLKNDFESLKYDGTIEGMGFLKDRIRGAANPIYLRDVVTVLNKAIEQHSRYYGLAVPLRNFNKLWNVNTRGATQDLQFDEENRPYTEGGDVINGYISSVKDAMRRAWFDAGENYIEKLVKDLSGVRKQAETFDKLLNMVRGSYAKAVLSFNLSVAGKQAASYPTAAAVIGWRPLARAMADIGRVNMDTINKYTPLQYHRSRGYSTQEFGDLAARGKSLPKALNWIQGMDVVTTRKLWKASEYYVRRANKDLAVGSPAYYKAVAAVYNRVIEETQPNYTTMQRPGLLRSESALLQSLMMFKTQPFQNYNILSDALGNLAAKRRVWKAMGTPEAKAAYKEAKRAAVRAVTSQFVANAVFVGMAAAWALFRGKTKDYKDDDDEYTWKSVMSKIGRDMVGTAAGMVPFGSEFWELVQSLAFDETYYGIDTVTASALSEAGSAIKKAWNSTATIIDDVKDPDKEANWNKYVFQMESVVNAISKLVGVPFENVTKLLKAVTLHAANAICDDEYEAQYVALRISTDPVTDSGAYIDNLYKAKKNGAKSYTELYNLMVNAGISEDKIKAGMEKRMKAAEGVEKVEDLDERYLAPKQETIYQKALRELEQTGTYKAATDEQKKGAKSDLYDLYAQTADGKKMREKIDEGKDYGVTEADYIEFLLSLHEHDEPTENGNYGSYTKEEIIAALKAMNVSNKEKAYLYSTKNSSKANNPWARYLPR